MRSLTQAVSKVVALSNVSDGQRFCPRTSRRRRAGTLAGSLGIQRTGTENSEAWVLVCDVQQCRRACVRT